MLDAVRLQTSMLLPGSHMRSNMRIAVELPCTTGLYDSVPLPPLREAPVDYAGERLLWDPAFRQVRVEHLVVMLGLCCQKALRFGRGR